MVKKLPSTNIVKKHLALRNLNVNQKRLLNPLNSRPVKHAKAPSSVIQNTLNILLKHSLPLPLKKEYH